MGIADRAIRLTVAIVLVVLYFNGTLVGAFGIIALIIAGVFALTSLVSSCPLYTLLGINTCKTKGAKFQPK